MITNIPLYVYILIISLNSISVYSHRQLIANEIVKAINDNTSVSWKAANSKFDYWSKKSIDYMLGVSPLYISSKIDRTRRIRENAKFKKNYRQIDLPDNFDPRKKWPKCLATLNEVRDQGSCGSCWAFGAVEAMSDRICINSNGKENAHLSAQDLVACCKSCGLGCFGGFPTNAWQYWISKGIVSGGNYESNQGCIPYSIPTCEHHANGSLSPCGDIVSTPKCLRQCTGESDIEYLQDRHYGKGHVDTSCLEEDIMQELFTNGPVEAAMLVYEDFLNYKSGVYHHVTGGLGGGHAIKLMGWGITDKGEKYWSAVNSWNSDWGEDGWFRIRRGTDECGIESDIVYALPLLSEQRNQAITLLYETSDLKQLLLVRITLILLPICLVTMVILLISKRGHLKAVIASGRGYSRIQ